MARVLPIDDVIKLSRYHVYSATSVEGLTNVTAEYVAERIGAGVTASFVALAFNQLQELGEVESIRSTKPAVRITPYGARQAEAELKKQDSLTVAYIAQGLDFLEDRMVGPDLIPASDRIVPSTHNQSSHDQAVGTLERLQKELTESNEVGEIFGDDRDVIIAEVSALRKLVEAAKARAAPTLALAKRTLQWISEKATAAAVGELAKRALSHIVAWLT